MNSRISNVLVCFILTVAVAIVVLYRISNYAKNDVINMPIIHRVVESLSYLPVSAGTSNSTVKTITCVTGKPCMYADVVDFRVIVITFNRAESLSKLLRSLDTLVLDENHAALEIWIDRTRTNDYDKQTFDIATQFNWTRGPTRVHVQVRVY